MHDHSNVAYTIDFISFIKWKTFNNTFFDCFTHSSTISFRKGWQRQSLKRIQTIENHD